MHQHDILPYNLIVIYQCRIRKITVPHNFAVIRPALQSIFIFGVK